jgi:hypothetical protein
MKTQRSTMSPASLGDADRIKFSGFFFLYGAPLLLAEDASVLH